jgi:hypothetical protein
MRAASEGGFFGGRALGTPTPSEWANGGKPAASPSSKRTSAQLEPLERVRHVKPHCQNGLTASDQARTSETPARMSSNGAMGSSIGGRTTCSIRDPTWVTRSCQPAERSTHSIGTRRPLTPTPPTNASSSQQSDELRARARSCIAGASSFSRSQPREAPGGIRDPRWVTRSCQPAERSTHSIGTRRPLTPTPPTNASSSQQSDELRAQARSCTQKAAPSVWQPTSRSPARHPRPTVGHPVLPASRTIHSLHLKPSPVDPTPIDQSLVLEQSDGLAVGGARTRRGRHLLLLAANLAAKCGVCGIRDPRWVTRSCQRARRSTHSI